MILQLREQRIREVFKGLSRPPYTDLRIEDICEETLDPIEKLFQPIFKEMRQLQT